VCAVGQQAVAGMSGLVGGKAQVQRRGGPPGQGKNGRQERQERVRGWVATRG
jgi:hypothetical protein